MSTTNALGAVLGCAAIAISLAVAIPAWKAHKACSEVQSELLKRLEDPDVNLRDDELRRMIGKCEVAVKTADAIARGFVGNPK